MTFEEYEKRPDFLEFTRIGYTSIALSQNNYELSEENKLFFDDKIVVVPNYEDTMKMINIAFKPYTDLFDYTIIEFNVVKSLNNTLYTAVRINVKN